MVDRRPGDLGNGSPTSPSEEATATSIGAFPALPPCGAAPEVPDTRSEPGEVDDAAGPTAPRLLKVADSGASVEEEAVEIG